MKISKLVEHQYRAKPKQLALKPILHLVCVLEEILGNASAEQLLAIIKDHQQLVALRKQCATPHHNTLDVYRIARKTSPFRARMNSATAKPF